MSVEYGRGGALNPVARDLAVPVAPVEVTAPCADIFDRLMEDPALMHIPVLRGDAIAGLVSRQQFMLTYASLYGRDIFGRKPITALMDAAPIIVEGGLDCEEVNRRLLQFDLQSSDVQGFIVVEEGRYLGVAAITGLLAVIANVMTHRAEELELARQRAEAASKSKTQFLASMSHELRTPLNAVIGFADLICKETFGPVAPVKYLEYVEDIHASGSHLLSMINDILDMAKIESGRFGLREDVFDPVDTAIDIVRMFMPEMKERQLHFRVCGIPGEDVPYVRADERHMRQILLNLLSNAVKFTPAGGHIDLCTQRHENGDLSLIVQDTGAGIPAHMVERVFEPFEQVECSFTRKTPGTGLGLPLARAMMEAHDGTLTLTSEEGKGTRVVARLPAERILPRKPASPALQSGEWPGVLTA